MVEIRSKNDTIAEIAGKVADYLRAGVRLVWVIDDAHEAVTEHRPNVAAKTFGKLEAIACDDVIPGFRLLVAELFRE